LAGGDERTGQSQRQQHSEAHRGQSAVPARARQIRTLPDGYDYVTFRSCAVSYSCSSAR
jgi:hypothetical protein